MKDWQKLRMKFPSRDRIKKKLERAGVDATEQEIDQILNFLIFLTEAAIQHYFKKH